MSPGTVAVLYWLIRDDWLPFLHLLLVFILPVAAVLAVGPILTGSLIGGTLLWTFAYLHRARQRVQTMQTPPLQAGEEALPESGTRPATASR
jgi:hypothetical protein